MTILRRIRARSASRSWILPGGLAAVAAFVALDWLTPAGVVVGILLSLPIIATALADDTRTVWIVGATALLGFLAAAEFGRGPISPAEVWAPNRIFAFLTIPGSFAIAHLLQRARLRAAAERERTAQASDLNRLLLSLLAHDMRSPLSMAVQAMAYLRTAEETGVPADPVLLADVEKRLRRGLGAIDRTLALLPDDRARAPGEAEHVRTGRDLLAELEAEALSFESEATARGKTLEVDLSGASDELFRTDPLLTRQALAILVDNAVRHAVPGSVRVTGGLSGRELRVIVSDDGPGRAPHEAPAGSGIGLSLCRALIARAGGDIARVDLGPGTHLALRVPLSPA